ncbi:MAG: GNAT family N-acetyltransferase [Flavobacterium sp.]|nr:GNAT family N-acetyltransferase [Flavobacterium sp.]
MNYNLTFKIYSSTNQLPTNWNSLSNDNLFLSKEYMQILEKSAPKNMECYFIGLFKEDELAGIALSQYINLNKLESFGERDRCIKTFIRNFLFKRYSSQVLLIGNNMLTGQNSFSFSDNIDTETGLETLKKAAKSLVASLKNKGIKTHLLSFKDFYESDNETFQKAGFNDYYWFSTQPNMVFTIDENWHSEQDYIHAFSKKYRDQYKRARKKAEGVVKKKMHLEDIIKQEETIYELYFHVAKNAYFNTFFLAKNHFRVLKEILKDKFLFYGYFQDEKLIGFNTLIKNGTTMDTYFLGYDESVQREKMLYLNMLYDMVAYSINKGFKEIVFARTALEIKSSIGAKPQQMYGYIKHENRFIDSKIEKIFNYLEPTVHWKERNPFK